MRTDLVASHIQQLRTSLGTLRMSIPEEVLIAQYKQRNYVDMVRTIREMMNLDMKVTLGIVSSGGPNAPAWILLPSPMPAFGTSDFRRTSVTLFLRKNFLDTGGFEEIVCAIAHEFSHVVLNAVNHPLREHEEAVDLTAMMLGFRDFYLTANAGRRERYGYLSAGEVSFAAHYMTFR